MYVLHSGTKGGNSIDYAAWYVVVFFGYPFRFQSKTLLLMVVSSEASDHPSVTLDSALVGWPRVGSANKICDSHDTRGYQCRALDLCRQ